MENTVDVKDNYPSDTRTKKTLRIIGMAFLGVFFAVLFALVFGLLVKWLWNFLMPDLFGLAGITYLQAFAMVVLAKLLFGAFGHHPGGHPPMGRSPFNRGHIRFGCHGQPSPDFRDRTWKYFVRYWEDEGKYSFDEYIRRSEKEGGEDKDE